MKKYFYIHEFADFYPQTSELICLNNGLRKIVQVDLPEKKRLDVLKRFSKRFGWDVFIFNSKIDLESFKVGVYKKIPLSDKNEGHIRCYIFNPDVIKTVSFKNFHAILAIESLSFEVRDGSSINLSLSAPNAILSCSNRGIT